MFIVPTAEPPHRVMIFGACSEGWYAASEQEHQEQALPALRSLLDDWKSMGFELLHSFDDDFFTSGPPGSLQFSFYILGEVPSLDALVAMMNRARTIKDGVITNKFFRFEARMGRKLFMLDD